MNRGYCGRVDAAVSTSTRPFPSEVHPLFREFVAGLDRGVLVVGRCAGCGRVQWPPRSLCGSCRGGDFEPYEIEPAGTVYTFTVVHRAFHPWFAERVPYGVAVVDVADSLRLTGLFEPVDALRCGLDVRGEVREFGGQPGLLWTPV
jgi:uncharacterized OB-fold protein